MKKFLVWLRDKLAFHCPKCGGRMYSYGYDSCINHLVYKCTECGELWV